VRLKAVDRATVALPWRSVEIGVSRGMAAYSWVRTSSAVTTRAAVAPLPAGRSPSRQADAARPRQAAAWPA